MPEPSAQQHIPAHPRRVRARWLTILAAAWALNGVAAPAAMDTEVAQLLARMEQSGCDFYRNGSWASAATARAHLERKYRALLDRRLIATTEQFIERGATRSSMSGEPYRVRCAGKPVVESGVWFGEQLRQLRGTPGEVR